MQREWMTSREIVVTVQTKPTLAEHLAQWGLGRISSDFSLQEWEKFIDHSGTKLVRRTLLIVSVTRSATTIEIVRAAGARWRTPVFVPATPDDVLAVAQQHPDEQRAARITSLFPNDQMSVLSLTGFTGMSRLIVESDVGKPWPLIPIRRFLFRSGESPIRHKRKP